VRISEQERRDRIADRNYWQYRQRNRDYLAGQQRKWRRKMQGIPAPRSGIRWTPEDDAVVTRDDITLVEMCFILGRSYDSVSARRCRLL
jgi:hypothetical protein